MQKPNRSNCLCVFVFVVCLYLYLDSDLALDLTLLLLLNFICTLLYIQFFMLCIGTVQNIIRVVVVVGGFLMNSFTYSELHDNDYDNGNADDSVDR